MKTILTLAATVAVLISATQSVTAQSCPPVSNLTAVHVKQAVAVTWQNPEIADAVLCYRWTLQQWGWRFETQWALAAGASSLFDPTVLPNKTYQYAVAVHYPSCGWAPWQYAVVGPYTSGGVTVAH